MISPILKCTFVKLFYLIIIFCYYQNSGSTFLHNFMVPSLESISVFFCNIQTEDNAEANWLNPYHICGALDRVAAQLIVVARLFATN